MAQILFVCPYCRVKLAKAEGDAMVCPCCRFRTTSEVIQKREEEKK